MGRLEMEPAVAEKQRQNKCSGRRTIKKSNKKSDKAIKN
jgi:hypothetical protein